MLLSKNYLLLNGEKIICFRSCEDASAMCCRVAIMESVQIPPECEMIVKGRPIDKFDKNSVGILEASEKFVERNGLMVAKALVCPETGMVPLRIMNINKEPCFVRKIWLQQPLNQLRRKGWRQLTPFPLVISKIEILTPTRRAFQSMLHKSRPISAAEVENFVT